MLLLLILLCTSLRGAAREKDEKPLASLVYGSLDNQEIPDFHFFRLAEKNADYRQAVSSIREFTPLELIDMELRRLMKDQPSIIRMQLPVDGSTTVSVLMVKYDPYTPDLTVGSLGTGRSERIEAYIPGVYYRGIIEGDVNSMAAISFFEDEIQGVVTTETRNWVLSRVPTTEKSGIYVLYSDAQSNLLSGYGFSCGTTESMAIGTQTEGFLVISPNPDNCVRVYFECDYSLYVNQGNSVSSTANYVTGFFNVISTLYFNESISTKISEIRVWTASSGYDLSAASAALVDFRNAMQNYNYTGDIAHYLATNVAMSGGIAYVDVLCNQTYNAGVTEIDGSYNGFPNYSWTVAAVAHEIGHNLGSLHTHECVWNGNGSQIDDCGNVWADNQGGVPQGAACYDDNNPILPSAGTIMSYCHLIAGVGIDFTLGFGSQPGDLIRDKVYGASCLHPCCDHVNDLVLSGTVSSPETHYVSEVIQSTQHVSGAIAFPGVNYYATEAVYLNDGFEADQGIFNAAIVFCHDVENAVVNTASKGGDEENRPVNAGTGDHIALSITPNPSPAIFSLQVIPARALSGIIYDIKGNVVRQVIITGEGVAEIDLSVYPPGIYFMQFVTGEQVHTRKIVKI